MLKWITVELSDATQLQPFKDLEAFTSGKERSIYCSTFFPFLLFNPLSRRREGGKEGLGKRTFFAQRGKKRKSKVTLFFLSREKKTYS